MKKHYELLSILPGTLAESEVSPIVGNITDTLSKSGAETITHEDLGKSRLSYPMKHIRYGYFHLFTFEAAPEMIPAMQEKLGLMPNLLRALISIYNPQNRTQMKKMTSEPISEISSGEDEVQTPAPAPAPVVEAPTETEKTEKTEKKEVAMEDIEKKLDEILDKNIGNL